MRRSTRRKLDKIGLATVSAGVVVLAAFGLKTLMDSGPDPESSRSGEQAFIPYETTVLPETTITPSTPASSPTPLTGTVGDDPLAGVGGFGPGQADIAPHKVTVSITSDGAVHLGFRFYKGGSGYRFADRTFSMTKTVRGTRPYLAQVAAKLQPTATWAKCSISVDGVVVVRGSTSEKYPNFTVCTA